ncbi:MAG TPA: CBS domain-containing protein [Thermoanaerobaculia bacterium]|nr:CBS domain-containing protein [Thermoanaerobaculia bacterium]
MRVADLMRKTVETVREDGSAEHALKRMRAKRLRHIVVVRGQRVVGIVSDRDVAALFVEGLRTDRTIDQVMSREVATALPGDSIEDAAKRMRRRKIGALPVVDGGRLVGILTVSDLLAWIEKRFRPRRRTTRASGRMRSRP